jgi:hypothetical protein
MVLEAVEVALETDKREKISIDGPLSVEHVLPQGGRIDDWPYATPETPGSTDQYLRRLTVRETLGNLTLLTQVLNSSVGNGPFSEKRPAIAAQSRLLSMRTSRGSQTPTPGTRRRSRSEESI